ncbi:MAG: hypothetical protein SFY69_00630 [Planctomycetota bacterium]|nr:hypothetical protein [Planctomycetota bacterium]
MQREYGEVGASSARPAAASSRRPVIQVWFPCSRSYLRVLRAADGSHYLARCPKCGLAKKFVVGAGGVAARQFEVDCGRR